MAKKKRSQNPAENKSGARPEQASARGFSWYPGHMVKAQRELEAHLKLCDAVLFLLDARAPATTRHQELEQALSRRQAPFIFVLNKVDLAEATKTRLWREFFRSAGHQVVDMSALKGKGPGPLTPLLEDLNSSIAASRARKGLLPRQARLMVAGLPNSGKSTLLNRLVGKSRFKTGNKPGLTRGTQWVTVADRYQLLDTPGILYPRIDGMAKLSILTAIGSVKRDVVPDLEVTQWLVDNLKARELPSPLAEALEGLEASGLQERPLEYFASCWGLNRQGDDWHRPVFDRFINFISTIPICWDADPK